MKEMIARVRGTKDLLPEEWYKVHHITEKARAIATLYGFMPIEVPIIEHASLFTANLGSNSDVVSKEMYTFLDKGNDTLTLRPEFTASVARFIVNNSFPLPARLFTFGPVFRYERPQKCRQRQFSQINFEAVGFANPEADIEVICLAQHIIKALKINDITLEVNSLGDTESCQAYTKQLIEYLQKFSQDLSPESQVRINTNPLRVLDSKNPIDQEVIRAAPTIESSYNMSSGEFFQKVLQGLDALNINYRINPRLVRGLDYYNHTVFEFKTSSLGSQDAVLAGGRYNGLLSNIGAGGQVPAVGFAGGIERIVALSETQKEATQETIAVIPVGEKMEPIALKLANEMRSRDYKIHYDYSLALGSRFKKASRAGVRLAIILGEAELANNQVAIRDFLSGEQSVIPLDSISAWLKQKYSNLLLKSQTE